MMQNIIQHAARMASIVMISIVGIPASASFEAQSVSAKAGRCSIYDPRPKCTETYRNANRRLFGLPTLEKIRRDKKHSDSKSELIVATVSLKSTGGVALVLQRDRERTPTVEIRQMLRSDRRLVPKPISVKIPESTWNMIVAKGKMLSPVYATDKMWVCGAIFTVELVDGYGNISAPVGDSCGNEPRGIFFEVLAEAALAQLPHCAALYPEGYKPTLDRLTACFVLGGEKMAAAELFNELERDLFWQSFGKADPSEIRPLFEEDVIFSWPGIPLIQDADTAAEFWAGGWFFSVDLQYDSFHATTPNSVWVSGDVIVEPLKGAGDVEGRIGMFTAQWLRGADGKFRMHRFEHSGTRAP